MKIELLEDQDVNLQSTPSITDEEIVQLLTKQNEIDGIAFTPPPPVSRAVALASFGRVETTWKEATNESVPSPEIRRIAALGT